MKNLLLVLLLSTSLFSLSAVPSNPILDSQYWEQKVQDLLRMKEPHLLYVSIKDQKMVYFKNNRLEGVFSISTAKNGFGQQEGSFQTPIGLHRIYEKIGHDAAPYSIFSSRKNTGKIWKQNSESAGKDLILSRIMWLEGLEDGKNRGLDKSGVNVDSRKRMIYIHGTNQEQLIGQPASMGCIRMKKDDLIVLFDRIPKGSLVSIQQ